MRNCFISTLILLVISRVAVGDGAFMHVAPHHCAAYGVNGPAPQAPAEHEGEPSLSPPANATCALGDQNERQKRRLQNLLQKLLVLVPSSNLVDLPPPWVPAIAFSPLDPDSARFTNTVRLLI
jgi:hypothetical protein